MERLDAEHLVIGSGVAGLMLALKLAKFGRVLVIAKGKLEECNTWFAQGGIASVFGPDDSFDRHIHDTLEAGAGLCHESIVRLVVENGPRLVMELAEIGARFTSPGPDSEVSHSSHSEHFHLTREGGHSRRRVIHAADWTGREILRALVEKVRSCPEITVREDQLAIDLVTTDKYAPDFSRNHCLGAYVLDKESRDIYLIRSRFTYLCTGGHGKVYLYTTNPDAATGDGLAMAWRAGCKVANLEFMQFHPTCLFHHKAKTFLISEAVRGEGGVLKNRAGRPFANDYHVDGSLAPRDIVARAIDAELKKSGETNVWLDVRHLGRDRIEKHFPNIYATCAGLGLDIAEEMIPVVPAAHYSCGGVVVDDWGRTGIGGLYALGEVACTGLHGGNRLASNSLLEAVVFADRVAEDVGRTTCGGGSGGGGSGGSGGNSGTDVDQTQKARQVEVPPWFSGRAVDPDELVVLTHLWDEIRRLMWNYVGIVRSEKRLKRALDRIVAISAELEEYYWDYRVTDTLVEVRNLALVAYLTVRCAMARKESRGIHFMLDPVKKQDVKVDAKQARAPRDTILTH